MKPVLLIDVVGLTSRQLGEDTPELGALATAGAAAPMTTVLPAVTCSAQATMLTGLAPQETGVVGNGWLDRASMDVALWQQSNHLMAGEKLYEAARARDAGFTCAKLFWWFNMGAAVEHSITPRPFYPADGRKILDVYSHPPDFGAKIKGELGPFPFFDFWGPRSGLPSSRWIADAARLTLERHAPDLTLVYLPHLDYDHQRYGPHDERSRQALRDVDAIVGDLRLAAERAGAELVVVSEYGIMPVERPVHVNRALREAGLLAVREGPPHAVGDLLDPFASRAFALADHQLAHVYTSSPADTRAAYDVLSGLAGVERVLDREAQQELGLAHERAGDLVCIADRDAWFTYYHWLDDVRAPDFARTVDIHRKPGYDPCELFLNPELALPKLRIALRLAQKLCGMRYLMDVIPLDATLVKGSHGRLPDDPQDGPVFLCSRPFGECGPEPESGVVEMTSVKERVLQLLERPAT